jgi:Na+/H+-dicarboxylate symporter
MRKLDLHWQILIAIVLAVIAGTLLDAEFSLLGMQLLSIYEFLGSVFLRALKMLIVPLVASSIIIGIAGIARSQHFGRLGGKFLLYLFSTMFAAVLIGLLAVNSVKPGVVENSASLLVFTETSESLSGALAKIEGRDSGDIAAIFVRMIPENIFQAAAETDLLGVIVFSLLFGYFMVKIDASRSAVMENFWQAVYEIMMKITLLVMKFAPIGVFGLVAKVVVTAGFASFVPMLKFFLTVVVALGIFGFIFLSLLLRLFGVSPLRFIKAMSPMLLMGFSTASSSATLPVSLECAQDRAGVSEPVASFVMPLGATVNMSGTALYECTAALFIAQAYGIDLSFTQQLYIVILATFTAIGVAGVPAASLVAISVILGAVGLPLEGIGLLLVTDRLLDMARTAMNIYGDAVGAIIIARSEGEQTLVAVSDKVET